MNSKQFAQNTRETLNSAYVTYSEAERDDRAYDQKDNIPDVQGDDMTGDTSHICVLDANGDAVSVTTSVGY